MPVILTLLLLLGADAPKVASADEKKEGFETLLTDGLKGWEQKGNWKMEDGVLTRTGKGGGLTYKTRKIPVDFELRFQWKVGKGSNSGVYYRPGQYEYQILDNKVHNDGKNPRTSAASLYYCMPPTKDVTKPVGEWNSGRIVCKGSVIQHWLNGVKVVDFDYADKKWEFEVALLRKRGAKLADGGAHLHIQDHGDPVWYRGIELRTIPPDEKVESENLTPATVPEAALKREKEYLEAKEKKK